LIAGNSEVKPVASHGILLGGFFVVLPHGLASYQHCGDRGLVPQSGVLSITKNHASEAKSIVFGVVQKSWENWLRSAEFF